MVQLKQGSLYFEIILFHFSHSSSASRNIWLLCTFPNNNRPEIRPCLPKLVLKYFEIKFYKVTAIALLVPEMHNYWLHIQNNNRLESLPRYLPKLEPNSYFGS